MVTGGYYGRYLPSGHLVYIHAATLFAVPFDLSRLEISGPAVPVAEGVSAIAGTGAAQFAVNADGSLVYAVGEGEDINAPLVWLDRQGKATTLRATRSNWGNVRFAPDGRRLALNITAPQRQIWVYEWAHDTSQLTFDPANGVTRLGLMAGTSIAEKRIGSGVHLTCQRGSADASAHEQSQHQAPVMASERKITG